jgi:hypothetical protein
MTTNNDDLANWQARFGSWEGSVQDLANLAGRLQMDLFPGEGQETLANVRLLRHYFATGLMTRGERRGKEAVFGLRQLLEYLAARALLRDGWPLAKIGLFTSASSDAELAALIPAPSDRRPASGASTRTRAGDLVARFRQERLAGSEQGDLRGAARRQVPPVSRRQAPGIPESLSTADAVAARLASQTRDRIALEARTSNLADSGTRPATARRTLTIELAPWCHVTVDEAALNTLDEKSLLGLVERLRRALRSARRNQGDDDGTV